MQRLARAGQCFAVAGPGPAMPAPCYALRHFATARLCHCLALPRHRSAKLCHCACCALLCHAGARLISAFAFACAALQCSAKAAHCRARAERCRTLPLLLCFGPHFYERHDFCSGQRNDSVSIFSSCLHDFPFILPENVPGGLMRWPDVLHREACSWP